MACYIKVAISIILLGSLVLLADGVTCYDYDLDHTVQYCHYCGFSNVTYAFYGTVVGEQSWKCLASANMSVPNGPQAVMNKCVVNETYSDSGTYIYSVYICDKDLCNTGCHSDGGTALTTLVSGGSTVGSGSTTHGNAGSTVQVSSYIAALVARRFS